MKTSITILLLFQFFTLFCQNFESPDYNYPPVNSSLSPSVLDSCIEILPASCELITDTVFNLNTLNEKCFIMNNPPLVLPAPAMLCSNGGAGHNMSWMAFQAGLGEYTLDLDIFACFGGQNGAQIGIVRINQCNFQDMEEIYCIGNPCVTGIQSIPSSLFIPGEIYYFFIDGCSGSVCHFNFTINGNYEPIQHKINDNVHLTIKGSIWGTEKPDTLKTDSQRGGFQTQVLLKNHKNVTIDSTIADYDGGYAFSDLPGGLYSIELSRNNFLSGGPLYGLFACPTNSTQLFTDNDNNGFGSSIIRTAILDYSFENILNDTIIIDSTIDFCLYDRCNTINPLAYSSLEIISDTICTLDVLNVFCASASYENSPQNIALRFCDETIQAYNTECFAFVAGTGDYVLEIDVYGCIGGLNGANVIVRDEWTKEDVFCSGNIGITGLLEIKSNLFIPGRTYYLIINGSEGSSCNYKIEVKGLFQKFNIIEAGVFTELPPYCLNDTINFYNNIDKDIYKANCKWNIYRISDNNTQTVFTSTNKLEHKFEIPGIHLIELESISAQCGADHFIPTNKIVSIVDNQDCDHFQVELLETKKITCEDEGYVILQITNGLPPYKVYVDNKLQPSEDTVFLDSIGFHYLKIEDAQGNQIINNFWIGGTNFMGEHNLSVALVASSFRRGISNTAWLEVSNLSCKSISGELILEIPEDVEITNATPIPTSINGKIFSWSFTELKDFKRIDLVLKTSLNSIIGSQITFNASALPLTNDLNPADNVKNYTYTITGSFDPNDKQAYPQGRCIEQYITKDQVIDYTIRFQNTGTAAAKDVYILDTISSDLDLSTFNIISSSHSLVLEQPRNGVLKFNFNDIELPALVEDSILSIGYVVFSVKPKPDILENTIIQNKSAIYFDFNDPIITNEVFHTVVESIPEYFNIPVFSDGTALSTLADFSEYTWIDCSDTSKIYTSNDATFNPPYNGDFRVEVMQNSCIGRSECISFLVGVVALEHENQLHIMPNPTTGDLTIKGNFIKNEQCVVQVFGLDGRCLKTQTFDSANLALDVSELKSGVYYLKLQSINGIFLGKFIKI